MESAQVEACGWGWRHAGRAGWAVRDLTLTVQAGERVLLLGPSGSGKSTLLQALAGVLGGADEGEEAGSLRVGGDHPATRRGIAGLVLQDPDGQVIMARVGDDVAFGAENLGVPRDEIWRRVHAALDAVGLDVPLDRPTSTLSGGEKQRLVLAGALAMRPRVLLLDEPTANLDPAGVREVRDAVAHALADRTMTLVVVEHRVDVWLPLVDRVIVLDPAGGVLADGPGERVFAEHGTTLLGAGVWVPDAPPAWVPRQPKSRGPAALRADDLSIGFPGSEPVQCHLDLAVPSGVSSVITGRNGTGKTTLALTLAGLHPALAGRVCASEALSPAQVPRRPRRFPARGKAGGKNGGRDRHDPAWWTSQQLLTRIGTVFQNPEHQFVAPTVHAELTAGLHRLPLDDGAIERRVADMLEMLRLGRLARANPFTLSGGEKRRLSVGTVLAAQPAVLVLDEPTFGQDRTTWAEVVALVGALRDEGRTIISVTHDADYVAALGENELHLTRQAS